MKTTKEARQDHKFSIDFTKESEEKFEKDCASMLNAIKRVPDGTTVRVTRYGDWDQNSTVDYKKVDGTHLSVATEYGIFGLPIKDLTNWADWHRIEVEIIK